MALQRTAGCVCCWHMWPGDPPPLSLVVSAKGPMSNHPPKRIVALGWAFVGVVMFCGGVAFLLHFLVAGSITVPRPEESGGPVSGITAWLFVGSTILCGAVIALCAVHGLRKGTRP